MQVTGQVLKVRSSEYVNKKNGQVVSMTYFDVYDDSCGVVQCSTRSTPSLQVIERTMITAEVQSARPATFGGGVNFGVRNVRILDGAVPPVLPVPPVPTGVGVRK